MKLTEPSSPPAEPQSHTASFQCGPLPLPLISDRSRHRFCCGRLPVQFPLAPAALWKHLRQQISPGRGSGLLRWARRRHLRPSQQEMTRHPPAAPTRHKQITVFIYITTASRRTLLFYYCRRQGHGAMIHGGAAKPPIHAVGSQRAQVHP